MATRRPASSRSRTNPMPPPQLPRSRSVMAKPLSQSTDSSTTAGESSSSSQQKDDGGTNIQVVIRCRRRSEREIQESSPIIVNSSGARSKDVSVETGAPVSSLGVVTLPPVRTYPFDLVFGPEADQAMIYHDVVSPMLEQVLQGYNCTLFAYGQTGTGKTYTMQGDLTPTPMGNPSAHAGMIPRVLFRLFHQLESSGTDYSVKISFVELYNEELRDLLASDLSAPAGATQPMGFGGKDTAKGGDHALKMFDDAGKRGVIIQGLEEIAVKDSKDALGLLLKGSERRQIAATNFNEHSSRSHSVFSITVHTKDISLGEDLLKIGKLHLVDLAGSENIGRSGAENKRAREAGMINQSLLTLGRVINALVDRAQHVPYRESKLTRLLQDSLGGRTKTCIIATISPARSNMEETLSTLDYALRAKSIRNKPEVNQRMTRNALLKEYVGEIDRLKADLLAAREKNGIFFSEETWNQLNAEQELRQTELVEAKKQIEIVDSQLRNVREEFEQSIGLLMKRDEELKETREKLEATKESLEQKELHLKQTALALQEEEVVRKAYQDSEQNIDGVATNLKTTLTQSARHVEGLQAKLDRKSNVLTSNNRAISKHAKSIASSSNNISESSNKYLQSASDLQERLQSQTDQFRTAETENMKKSAQILEQRFSGVWQRFQIIQSDDDADDKLFDTLEQDLYKARSVFESHLEAWGMDFKQTIQRSCMDAGAEVTKQNAAVEKAIDTLQLALENMVRQAKEFLREQRQLHLEMKEYSSAQSTSEVSRLRKENEMLGQMVEQERSRSNASKDNLLQRISGLLGNFLQERDESLSTIVQGIQQSNDSLSKSTQLDFEKYTKELGVAENRAKSFETVLNQSTRENKRKREVISKSLANTKQALDKAFGDMQGSINDNVGSFSSSIRQQHEHSVNLYTSSLEEHAQLKRARLEETTGLKAELESNHTRILSTLSSTSTSIETFASTTAPNLSELKNITEAYHKDTMQNLQAIQNTTTALLDKGTREDVATGDTPQKRQWKYVDQWQLAKSREEILNAWRHQTTPDAVQHGNSAIHSAPSGDTENLAPKEHVAKESIGPSLHFPPVKPIEEEASRTTRGSSNVETLMESRKRNVSTRYRR